jgi:hypothetical protein
MSTRDELIDALADLVQQRKSNVGYKHDLDAGFTLTTNFMHGPSGIFGTLGAERDVFSTRVRPRGLLSVLPAFPNGDISPITYYLTGITAESGTEPDAPCETCIKAGNIKSCRQGTAFGLICRETDELDLTAVGQHVNRGEYYDLRLVNDPLLNNSPLWVPPSVPKAFQDVLNRELLARLLTVGAAFETKLANLVFTGNPANNSGTGYAEYQGLELLVTTGHVDILDGTSCPSLDSDIKEFNNNTVEDHAATLFAYMQMLYRYVRHNAETMGFMPVEWAWVIKDSLFRKLADYWPCVYASSGCNATANDVNNNVDGMTMRAISDEMYTQRYLTIDGIRIPVIVDDAVPYDKNGDAGVNLPPGQFSSDIYLLPFTVVGGRQVLFMEYFDYSATNGAWQAIQDARMTESYWTDGGRWIWTRRQTDWCIILKAKIMPRLRLLTPHLAGRIQNVSWTPLQALREPFPGQGYFTNGGNITASPSNLQYDYEDLIRLQ